MAGYTEITIGGQQVGLRFGIAAIKSAREKKAIKIVGEVIETQTTVDTAHYLRAAYIDNCYVKEVDAVIPFEKFVEWAEEQEINGGAELQRVTKVISESNYVKPKEEAEDKKDKKKVRKSTGTK